MEDDVPNGLTKPVIASAIAQHGPMLEPSDAKAFGVVMDKIMTFAATFGILVENSEELNKVYRTTLGDLPIDLLGRAVDATLKDWTYQSLPKPADIRKHVADDLGRRRSQLRRMEIAMLKAPKEAPVVGSRKFDASAVLKRLNSGGLTKADHGEP